MELVLYFLFFYFLFIFTFIHSDSAFIYSQEGTSFRYTFLAFIPTFFFSFFHIFFSLCICPCTYRIMIQVFTIIKKIIKI
ncbi:hypothetical protein BDF14DRAFT_1784178 [Spinellus fusiger]|nr:hypothetical protein BDF14DRAFT_1784178 [Spinellus fusiger]